MLDVEVGAGLTLRAPLDRETLTDSLLYLEAQGLADSDSELSTFNLLSSHACGKICEMSYRL